MAAAVSAFLLYPTVTELIKWADSVGWDLTIFGFISVSYSRYPSSVLPIIIIVWIQVYVERFAQRMVPYLLKTIFVPVLVMFSTAFLGLTLLGPVGTWIGNLMSLAIRFLNTHVSWLVPTLIGTLSLLYGIAIPLKKTLYAAMAAGGLAGLFAGIVDIKAYSFVTPGLLSLVGYLSVYDSVWNFIFAILTAVLAFVLGFIFTMILGFEEADE